MKVQLYWAGNIIAFTFFLIVTFFFHSLFLLFLYLILHIFLIIIIFFWFFRDIPGCSGMLHVLVFIDGPNPSIMRHVYAALCVLTSVFSMEGIK